MADQTHKKSNKKDKSPAGEASAAGFDPKPVTVGGESLVERLYPHRYKIGVFIGSALVIWAIVAIVIHFHNARDEQATNRLAAVLDLGENPVRAEGEAAGSAAGPTFADPTARADALLEALAKEHTDAAGPVYRASLLVQAGKLDDAIAEYKKAQGKLGIEGVLAREGLGLAEEQKAENPKNDPATRQKGLEEALATFQSMQPDAQGPRRDFALYHQGRMLVLLGKPADAKTAFDKAKELAKDNPTLTELISERLASLGA